MKRPRRNHSATFKAKVALAAIKGDKTMVELSEQFKVHPNQIGQWRAELLERAAEVFATAAEKREAGARMLRDRVRHEGWSVGRKHVATLMRRRGVEALYRKANTSRRHAAHPVYPYLLRGWTIDTPNQVWAMDTTYIPMRRGFVYLTVVLDWAIRRMLAWRLSNSLGADVAVAALEEALTKYG